MRIEQVSTRKLGKYEIVIEVVDFCCGCSWLRDLYESTDEHIAGTTIQVPSHLQSRNTPKYYIGQTTPAELASQFAKQGRENPSAEAYKSLQENLEHYIVASDCSLRVRVLKGGHELSSVYGISAEYSDIHYNDYTDFYNKALKQEKLQAVRDAISEAREVLEDLLN